MNRRGDMEIVINTRILERALWLVLVLVLATLLWWRWDASAAHSTATTSEEVATLQTQLADRDARIASLEAQKTSVPTSVAKPNATNSTVPTAAPTTPTPTATNSTNTTKDALAFRWTQTGSHPSTGKYKLEQVTVTVDSTKVEAVPLSYTLCWSSIECERAVTKGTFNANPSTTTEQDLAISIPTFVDISKGQKLRLVIFDNSTKKELFREDVIIR